MMSKSLIPDYCVTDQTWGQANQEYLFTALRWLRGILEHYLAGSQNYPLPTEPEPDQIWQLLQARGADLSPPPLLEQLRQLFQLSDFEWSILLLCVGIELDPNFVTLCAAIQGEPRSYPTLSLAMAILPDAHWSAMSTARPLRRWQLVSLGEGQALTHCPLRIDERVLHFITGVEADDERLMGLISRLEIVSTLVPSQQTLVEQVAIQWQSPLNPASFPMIQFCGPDSVDKQAIAAAVCQQLGLQVSRLPVHHVPLLPGELQGLIRIWEREARLTRGVLLLDCDQLEQMDTARTLAMIQLIQQVNGLLMISSREPIAGLQRQTVRFDVAKPTPQEQLAVWQESLANLNLLNGHPDTLTHHSSAPLLPEQLRSLSVQFSLSAPTIRQTCAAAVSHWVDPQRQLLGDLLWDTCRQQARPRLEELAQRIEPMCSWDDLVLPDLQADILREMAAHVRQRATVYGTWGFASKSKRGLGISALFSGPSGTGKTLGAEVLAQELRLDLYKIDLSSVISKYIGETEKNLQRVFEAAETGGVILLFDEADALFGKRSEVKDARDRYANIEVSYLLQRMETYPGLSILTTNLKSALDTAFLRRLRFVVHFPFPDAAQRAEIWRRVFPANTPTEGLKIDKLAQLNMSGGNIRNIALNAAFLAADAQQSVQMQHILRAAQTEYAKLEKSLTDTEIAGWL
jgi:hypothetical protein